MTLPGKSSFYEIELVSLNKPNSTLRATLHTPEEVLSFLETPLRGGNCAVIIARIKDHGDYGNFVAFLNESGLAYVRLLEHQGFCAKRSPELSAPRKIIFKDETSIEFAVDENQTIPVTTALQALDYWLPAQQQFPQIYWEAE
ncbi:MAG: hypothetical protein NTZ64_08820 [Polaromonas sp.]|nr:hypothetical protein [Polaromonas sp.]